MVSGRIGKIGSLTVILILLIQSTSCSSDISVSDSNKKDKSFSIFLDDSGRDKNELYSAMRIYNKTHDVKVVNMYEKYPRRVEHREEVRLELMAGQGPDIMIIENGTLDSLIKIFQTNVFYDLNTLISQDNTFNFSLFNKKVLDSGVFEGKRYIMPLGYNIYAFDVKSDARGRSKTIIDKDNWNWETLGKTAVDFMKTKDPEQYYFYGDRDSILYTMILNNGTQFIDYTNKQVKFESPKFIKILQLYKDYFYLSTTPDNQSGETYSRMWYKAVVFNHGFSGSGVSWMDESSVKYDDNYTMPALEGDKSVYIEPVCSVGIISKCKYKKEAYEFIKLLLTDDIQKESPFFPVNKKTLANNFDGIFKHFHLTYDDDFNKDVKDETDAAKQKKLKQFDELENYAVCQLIDYSVLDIIKSELPRFLNGNQTAEQTAKAIDGKVMLFLNE